MRLLEQAELPELVDIVGASDEVPARFERIVNSARIVVLPGRRAASAFYW
jgi:hypothetical protein